jgi:putative membrane protein
MMFGMGFMGLLWVLITVLIGWGVFSLFNGRRSEKYFKNFDSNEGLETSTLEILKQRYVRGELSQAEFERMKKDLFES